jgi:hypothetical protein
MNNESIEKLRIDNRLRRRRGWISDADLQTELDALPDVSDKIREPDEEETEGGDEASASASEAAVPALDSPDSPDSSIPPEDGGA